MFSDPPFPRTSPELRSLVNSGDVCVGSSFRGCSTTYSQTTGKFTASTYVAGGARQLRMEASCRFCYLFIQLSFKCSSLFKNCRNAFPLKLTLQGIEVSFPGNTGLDGSHPSNEPPWRRLGDVSSQLRFPGDAS